MPSLRLAHRLHLVTVAWLRPLRADSAIAGALLCHQGRRPQSLCSLGAWRCRASALHVAQTIPRLPWTELCHQPVSHEDSSPGQEARTFQLGWAPFASALGGYFQILGDVPLALHLIGPRCPLFPRPPLLLAVLKPHCWPAWGLLSRELPLLTLFFFFNSVSFNVMA